MSWTQPQCERCWIEENSIWESLPGGGEVLKSIRFPVRITEPEIKQCAVCGELTISGIFVRKDPKEVNYPQEE